MYVIDKQQTTDDLTEEQTVADISSQISHETVQTLPVVKKGNTANKESVKKDKKSKNKWMAKKGNKKQFKPGQFKKFKNNSFKGKK